jgi:glutamate 5-kinase
MMNAKTLILLSNIDGIYDGDPSDSGSSVISKVRAEDNLEKFIQTGKSSAGRGGMASKYNTARSVAESGIRVIIANGNRDNILPDVLTKPEDTIHTEFVV